MRLRSTYFRDKISIHAPREGSDVPQRPGSSLSGQFLSTLPARGATGGDFRLSVSSRISIHAPREGSDVDRNEYQNTRTISIHAPREGSDTLDAWHYADHYNISIHAPREGSDLFGNGTWDTYRISIHAPREGSDSGRA